MVQMKQFKKRFLSFLLALTAVLSLLPTFALAAVTTGTGIAATTDANRWSTRLNAHGQPYTYKPPVINGKYLYCVDRGYSWRWGNPSFTGSYTYKYATGADADAVLADAIASSGLGEASADALENIKWMASYVNDYTGEIPGALFMAMQTYIWDNQSDKTASGDASGDIDAGGYANADTYDIYLGYIDFMLGEKAKEDAKLQQQVEKYDAQGIPAEIVEDESQKWAMLASSNVSGRQHFFTYHTSRKVEAVSTPIPGDPDTPNPPDEPQPPSGGKGTITLKKVVEGTTRGLDGAVFNIYFNGQIVGSDVTSNGGVITVEDVKTGLWSFVEVSAPEGYAADPPPHSVYVDVSEGDKEYTVSVSNAALPGLRIIKTDAQSGTPVPNTVFSVKSVTGSFSATVTTGGDGTGTLLDLEPGVYVVREESVPEPYIRSQTEQTVALQPGKTSEAAFTNYKKSGLEILKKSMADGAPIYGVTFLVEQIDGGFARSVTTDHSGRVFLENIPAGSYKITETAVPEDVIISNIPQTVSLEPGTTATVTFRNTRKSAITIRKTDAQTGDPVPGVTFTLNKVDGTTITTEPTGPDGTVTISLLEPGVYAITEQNVPEPYILDTTPQQVTLFPDRDASVEFQNYKKPELTLSKIDADSGDPIPKTVFTVKGIDNDFQDEWTTGIDGKVSLRVPAGSYQVTEKSVPAPYYLPDKDADRVQTISLNPGGEKTLVFKNHKAPELTIFKEDSVAGAPIEGAKFHVTYTSNGESAGAPASVDFGYFLTDSSGQIKLHEKGKKLYPGEYTVTEVEPAPGFQMKEPTTQKVIIRGGESKALTFQNEPLNGIVVQKYDSVTGEALPGCTFQLRFLGGTSGTGGTVISQKVTGQNGTCIWTGLTAGIYVIEEVDPADGYSIIKSSETVYISDDGVQNVVTVTLDNAPDGLLLIRKVCSVNPSVTLQDAEFKITYADGTVIGDSNGIYRTDENGEICISGLKPGKSVIVTETKAPAGFLIDTQSQAIQIKEGRTVSLTFKNQPRGKLIIQKRDSITGQPLPGAEFRITTAAGCEVGLDGVIGTATLTQNGIFTTDSNGEIRISNLAPGALILTEIKAPAGYVIDTPSTNVMIGPNGDTQTVIVTDTPKGGLVVEKYDKITKQPLAGARFKIAYSNGELLPDNEGLTSSNGLYTTDQNGQIVLSKVRPGTLVVTEDKAPDFYQKDPTPQTVVVSAGDTQTLRFYDDPLCTLTILKRDAVTHKPLSGGQFLVQYSDGRVVGPNNGLYTTGVDGTVTVSGLKPNATVVVSEQKAPKGYILDQTPKNIVVRSGVANGLIFDDQPGTTLIIQKFIEGTENEPLSGVAFKVTDGSGAAVGPDDGTYYTDKAGEIVLSGIEPGTTVKAREIKTVDGFVLDGTPQDILIKGGEVQRLTFWNKRAGTLVIQKKDSVTGALIAGAQFQLTYANGGYVDNDNGHLSSNGLYTTDDKGEIRISGITGTVVAKEVTPAPGYVIDQSTQTQTVTVNPLDTQTLTFLNEPLCSLTLTKLDSVTGKPVPGTEFAVKDGDGNMLGRYVTGKDGTVVVTGLIPGSTVVVSESRVPDGYVLNTTPQTIIVKNGSGNRYTSGGGSSGTGGSGSGGSSSGGNDLTFENDPKMTLTIHKYIEGTANEPLAGVAFKVVDGSGKPLNPDGGVYYTNNAGEIVLEGLEPGTTITAQEIKTVDGYVLDGRPQSIKIEAGKAQNLTFWNQRAGSLVIQKLDKLSGKPLSGVEFELTYAEGGFVDNANGHLSSNGRYTTNDAGEIRISGITGTIVVKEVKCLPGYTIDPATQTQTVTVNPADTQVLKFYNVPGTTLTIQKLVTGTKDQPLVGVEFLITDSSGAYVGPNQGIYRTDEYGRITLSGLKPGTVITAKETKTVDGYVLDGTPKSIEIKEGEAQTLTFYNSPIGGLELIKVSESDKTKRIPNTTFEIRTMDGALVDTVTTDSTGQVHVDLDAGDYYCVELKAAEGFKIDATPHYFTIRDNETTTLTVANAPFSGIIIHKINSVTGDGIYDVKFLLYDENKNPIGEYATDNEGYIYIDDLTVQGKGRLYLRELEAAPGYELDKEYKTIYVQPGKTIEVEWENTPITGQIQVMKYAAEYNEVTGTPAGTPLQGAIYEISDPRSNKVVDYITTDARGIAASKPLPLGRYKIVEVTAPVYWQLSKTVFDETLEYAGQIIKVSDYDKPSALGVIITKRGNAEVLAGNQMRYDFTVANTSNVPLENFYWHDRVPTDAARAMVISTGTYSARLNYRILYKTNCSGTYRVLASNLITTSAYSFSLSAIPMQAGEYVTDVYFDFGKVPVGFQSASNPTLTVAVSGTAANGYQLTNRADAGGKYQGTWQTAQGTWVTVIRRLTPAVAPKLPKTGY